MIQHACVLAHHSGDEGMVNLLQDKKLYLLLRIAPDVVEICVKRIANVNLDYALDPKTLEELRDFLNGLWSYLILTQLHINLINQLLDSDDKV